MKLSFGQYSDGKTLYDDFSSDQIEAWFGDKEEAYYKLPGERAPGVYAFHARNWRQGSAISLNIGPCTVLGWRLWR
jgi:hypothetical protein